MIPPFETCNRKSSLHPVREKVQAAFSGCLNEGRSANPPPIFFRR
ncbi:hypothetical protein HMPREF9098_0362 [Kingella denitrificans ATCC 33394]|uniref:Uncharacterized protein n=1 Tax=Kingella denitrificans ATCC 33394 TaxID=888741 RepID=F0EWY2_9NEIS|nr:hypothetical protein HMPREF9098_0362 [Kingella denitrificans ATCC 33394]